MPMKRSSDSSGRNGVFLIHSLQKTCDSPEGADLKTQTLFEQEDDSGIKSGGWTALFYSFYVVSRRKLGNKCEFFVTPWSQNLNLTKWNKWQSLLKWEIFEVDSIASWVSHLIGGDRNRTAVFLFLDFYISWAHISTSVSWVWKEFTLQDYHMPPEHTWRIQSQQNNSFCFLVIFWNDAILDYLWLSLY